MAYTKWSNKINLDSMEISEEKETKLLKLEDFKRIDKGFKIWPFYIR